MTPAMTRQILLAGCSILATAALAAAQDDRASTGLAPNISVSFAAVPARDVGTTGQQYSARGGGIGVSVPLKGGWDWDGTNVTGFHLLAHARFHVDSADVPYQAGTRTLYSGSAGVSAVHLLNSNTQLSWSLAVGIAEDRATMSDARVRVTGRLLVRKRSSDKVTLLYGGAYTFVFGKGRLLPVFGVLWRPGAGTLVSIVAPFSARVRHQATGSRLSLAAQAGMRGNQYHVADNTQYSSPTHQLQLRLRELRAGGEVGYVIGRSLALVAEAGVAAARKLTFADGKTELFATTVKTGPYAAISLRLSFSKKSRWESVGEW